MAMDILGYYLILKEGKDLLPEDKAPIFTDMKSIATRESAIVGTGNTSSANKMTMNDQDIQSISNPLQYQPIRDNPHPLHI